MKFNTSLSQMQLGLVSAHEIGMANLQEVDKDASYSGRASHMCRMGPEATEAGSLSHTVMKLLRNMPPLCWGQLTVSTAL